MSNLNDFVIENGVLKRYKGEDTEVVIPDGVTEIGKYAFYGCESLKRLTIPDSVTKIEDFAFLECESLTSISIPEGVTEIGEKAFRDCKSLKSITIPEGVTEIGEFAFCNCESLISITIPEGVTTIGGYAFHGCKCLTSIAIPESVTKIGEAAFWGCESLASITIPEGVTEIGKNAFNECKSLTSITIPESVTAIGNWGFGFCTSLEEIVAGDISNIPNEDKFLAIIGFANSNGQGSEKRVESHKKYIKTNAAKLVNLAMKNISLLSLMCREKLITPKNLELYVQKANESKNTESIALMLDYSQTKITAKQKEAVEKKKEAQEEEMFERAIARSEKEGIKDLRFAATGYLSTFKNRDELKEFIVENGGSFSTTISSKVDYLIVNNPEMEIVKVKKAQEMGAEIITEREFNEKINRIFQIDREGVLVKYMGAGGDVVIPDGVTKIWNHAFRECESLTSITIPDSVTWIEDWAFYGCKGLADEKGFVIVKNVLYDYFGDDKKVVIPDGVTKIGDRAFWGRKRLTNIFIPDGVTWIGEKAFWGCESLESITIPEGVTWIGESIFQWCTDLKEIVAGDISIIPTEYKVLAVIGFVNSNGQGSEKRVESHKKYIKTNAAKLVDWAVEDISLLTLMCRERLLTPKNLELYVQKATESKNAEATALMLDYSQTKVTTKKKEAVAKKKETATEEVVKRTVARSAKDGIEGLCFALAGKLKTFKNKDELTKIIIKNGGSFSTTISSKVDYLIANDADAGDAKTKKAQEMGIEIITEYAFNEKINRVFQMNIAGVLVGYTGVGGDVVVPDGVTRIGGAAFIDCERLTSITIPDGVTEVGQYAFSGCKNLTSITIPDGVTKIREYAFCGCKSLTSITIPKSVTKIGRNAFFGCENLTSITIPDGVTWIGDFAFWFCEKLTIHAPAGSYAERYAKDDNIPFTAE